MIGIYYGVDDVNIEYSGVVYSYPQLYEATYNPMVEWQVLILDKVSGRTYAEKKAFVHDLAVEWSHMMCNEVEMDYYDLGEIDEWFRKYGRRYGLMDEFKENGIC